MNNNEASKRTLSFYCVACGQVFKSQEDAEFHHDKEHKMKVSVDPEFQRGEWVEVSTDNDNWVKRIFYLKTEGTVGDYFCVGTLDQYIYQKGGPVEISGWPYIRKIPQPQQPKKTVLKAPAIKCGIMFSGTNHVHGLYRSKEEAQKLLGSDFLSFPAKIRLKDGTDQELWFVCEEES